jgi:TetR/AcrR family transcriptional repressor of nem operon
MARGREFDERTAVERAMRLFWRRGYSDAALPEILGAMNLSRGSFYNAFGSKRATLVQAIRRYMEGGMDEILSPLFGDDAGRAEIEETFARMVAHTSGPKGRDGCLVNNCMTEVAVRDAEIRRVLIMARGLVENGFARAAARGQAEGTISTRERPESIGRFLLNKIGRAHV